MADRRRHRAAIQAERVEMLAGGTQLSAVGVSGAFIIAPTSNGARQFSVLLAGGGRLTAGMLEMAAWALTGQAVPSPEAGQEDADAWVVRGTVCSGHPIRRRDC